jgi:hypothetical protein
MLKYLSGLLIALCLVGGAQAQGIGVGLGTDDILTHPGGGQLGPALDFNFSRGVYFQGSTCSTAAACLTVTRATTNGLATDLLPTSAAGQTITTFADNVARISSAAGGLISEEARVNQLVNATTPATQTSASINCASPGCTLWVNGASGSATASAGTATGCSGFAAATNGSPNTFTCTGAGTIVVTVTGTLNAFQLEIGGSGTSLCTSTASACSRGADVIKATTTPAFGSAYTLLAQGIPLSADTNATTQFFLSADDGTASNRLGLYRVNVATANFVVASGGSSNSNSAGSAWSRAAAGKVVGAATTGTNGVVSFNGSAVATVPQVGPAGAALTNLYIGCTAGVLPANGVITRIAVWPTVALTNAQMQAITQ